MKILPSKNLFAAPIFPILREQRAYHTIQKRNCIVKGATFHSFITFLFYNINKVNFCNVFIPNSPFFCFFLHTDKFPKVTKIQFLCFRFVFRKIYKIRKKEQQFTAWFGQIFFMQFVFESFWRKIYQFWQVFFGWDSGKECLISCGFEFNQLSLKFRDDNSLDFWSTDGESGLVLVVGKESRAWIKQYENNKTKSSTVLCFLMKKSSIQQDTIIYKKKLH